MNDALQKTIEIYEYSTKSRANTGRVANRNLNLSDSTELIYKISLIV